MYVRIRVKRPARPEPEVHAGYPVSYGRCPDMNDVEVFAVDNDGNEHPLEGITGVWIAVHDAEPVTAIINLVGPEVDVYAVRK